MKRKTYTVWIELDPDLPDKDITLLTGTKTGCKSYYKQYAYWWRLQGYPLHLGYFA